MKCRKTQSRCYHSHQQLTLYRQTMHDFSPATLSAESDTWQPDARGRWREYRLPVSPDLQRFWMVAASPLLTGSSDTQRTPTNFTPNSITKIKFLGLFCYPRYMHKASRRKIIHTDNTIPHTDCGAATPSMLTDRRSIAPTQRHQNQPQVRTQSPLACVNGAVSSTSPASGSVNAAAFMLLNPRSLNNKALLIHDIITDRKTDFLCLTETWQHQQDFLTLNQVTPSKLGLHPEAPLQWLWWWAGSHTSSRHPALQKPPPPSCLSCLNYSPLSALYLHLHSCLVISTSMWTPPAAPLPLNSCHSWTASTSHSMLKVQPMSKATHWIWCAPLAQLPPIYNAWTSLFLTTMLSSSLFLSLCPSSA